jgi:hypothetical protein
LLETNKRNKVSAERMPILKLSRSLRPSKGRYFSYAFFKVHDAEDSEFPKEWIVPSTSYILVESKEK